VALTELGNEKPNSSYQCRLLKLYFTASRSEKHPDCSNPSTSIIKSVSDVKEFTIFLAPILGNFHLVARIVAKKWNCVRVVVFLRVLLHMKSFTH